MRSSTPGNGGPTVPKRYREGRLTVATDAQRPVDQPALDSGRLTELRGYRRVNLLENTRDTREDGRANRRQRLRDGVWIGTERNRVADVRAQQGHAAAEIVREREEE